MNMNLSARYVTQQNMWSVQYGKPLTDRRIAQLQRQGHYSSPFVKFKVTEQKRNIRRLAVSKMFAQF